MSRDRLICLLAALLVTAGHPAAAATPAMPPPLRGPSPGGIWEATLPNGLKVLMKEVHTAPLFCSSVWYRGGSRNETAGSTGVAHLLEHMMWKGTARHGKGEFDRILEANGALNNGSTWHDRTEYHILISAEKADLALELEADRMRGALLSQTDLDDEMTVVRNEMEKGEDDPWNELDERLEAVSILEHPYHWPVIGWKSDVEAARAGQLRRFYDGFYQPNNAYLVLVGDLPVRTMLEMAVRHFGPIPRGPEPEPVVTVEPPQKGERRFVLREEGRTRILAMGYRAPGRAHPDGDALDLLGGLLGTGRSSRLYPSLVESGLATSIRVYNGSQMRDPFLFYVWVELAEGAAEDSVELRVNREVERLWAAPPSREEVERARKQIRVETLFSRDELTSLMEGIGEAESAVGYAYYDSYLDSLATVTPEDVQRVARTYLRPESRTVGLYLPAGTGGGAGLPGSGKAGEHVKPGRGSAHDRPNTNGPAGSPRTSGSPPATTEAGGTGESNPLPASSPSAQRFVLSNGAVILVQESRENPTVELRARCDGGMLLEPPGKEGVASLLALTLPLGTARRSAAELADTLESHGIDLSFASGPDAIEVQARALAEDFPTLVRVLGEVLATPSFPEDQLEIARAQARSALDESLQDTGPLAQRRALGALFGPESPYARFPEGTDSTLAALGRDDLIAFHREILQARRWSFAVVGDVSGEEVRERFEAALRAIPPGEPIAVSRPSFLSQAPDRREGTGGRFPLAWIPEPIRIEVPDKSQVDLVFAGPGVAPSDPEFPAAFLADVVLGEAYTSRLQARLRDDEGLTYDAGSSFLHRQGATCWMAALGVNPQKLEQALSIMRQELETFRSRPITEEELMKAREYAAGSFPIRLQTKSRIAETLLFAQRFGLGAEYISGYAQRMRGVTLEQVRRASLRFADPGRLVVVMAGSF